MIEIWRDIIGYEGIYQVSDMGNVKSLARKCIDGRNIKERILKGGSNGHGYLIVGLRKEGKTKSRKVHQLVAESFLNHTPNGHKIVVDHRNNDKLNNRLDNLQLISARENISKDIQGGSSKYTGVSWEKRCNKWRARIHINGKSKHLGCFIMDYTASIAYQTALHNHLKK